MIAGRSATLAAAAALLAWSGPSQSHDPVEPAVAPPAAAAEAKPSPDRPQQPPNQRLPLDPGRKVNFVTNSGTWMSLDVNGDGGTIVFDLLGDLYTLSTAGGEARRISSGLAFDTQPTFSPNGRWIAFVSDRSGADNLWLSRPDGSAPRQISFGDDDTVLASPAWSADGTSLFISRYVPSLNNYELWRYDLDGRTTLLAPIKDPGGPRSTLGAVASPDGKWLYYARRVGGLDFDEVNEWSIVRRDLASGEEKDILREVDDRRRSARGSFFRPALSRYGRLLAYASRNGSRTELRVRDLATGEDKPVAIAVERDQLQASMWQDIVPRYAFSPDGRSIVLSRNGGFERIDVDGGAAAPIPFSAKVALDVGPSTRVAIREPSGPVRARLIQSPVASPDGKTVVFSALARLYIAALGSVSAPVALDSGREPAFQPSWSKDGRQIAFVTWSEKHGGSVWTAPSDRSSAPVRRSKVPAFYTYPVFAPDGRTVIAVRSPQAARNDTSFEYGKLRKAELVAIPLDGSEARVIASGNIGSRPHFVNARPGSVAILADGGLAEFDIATGKRTDLALVKGPGWYFQDGSVPVDDARVSPDGKWILAQVAQQLHLVAMPAPGAAAVDLLDPHLPHRRLTDVGADFFEWSADGKDIYWSVGSTLFRRPLSAVELNPAGAPSWAPDPKNKGGWALNVEVPRARPKASLLLRGARVLTMADKGAVIENADLLVRQDRIAAIGPRGSVQVPADTEVVDVSGRTIIPGLIDTHDHLGGVRREVLGLDEWGLQARLAFGITTSFDPSSLSIDMLAYQDLLDTGMMVGPRLRTTGPALFSMNRFGSIDEVRAVLRRYRDHYGLRNIKQYRTGNRRVRQWIAQAAGEMGLLPTTEGALSLKLDLTQILDGFAGHEHALPVSLQQDVLTVLTRTRTSYTTTLQITNGSFPAQDWFVINRDPHEDPRIRRFWPPRMIASQLTERPWRRLDLHRFPATAADAAALQRAGGLVGMGSHGDLPGIGFHFEMEAHAMGGMTPAEVLRAATIGAAETIGRAADLGSIEPGKLADLLVLTRDPRTEIKAARGIEQVMRGGILFDASLNQLWPERRPLNPHWRTSGNSPSQWLPAPAVPTPGRDHRP